MADNNQTVEVRCYSEKADVSLSFSIEFCGSMDELGTKWIYEGVADSFWENTYEFEEYISIAKEMVTTDRNTTYETALKTVFGHFAVSFSINGNPVTWSNDIDINDQMYALLSEL